MPLSMGVDAVAVTIVNGSSLSPAVALGAKQLHGIAMPAAWDAADLTFQVAWDGSTFEEMTDTGGNAIDYKAAASKYIPIDPTLWRAVSTIKVRSGTSGAPVNQSADRVLQLIIKPIA